MEYKLFEKQDIELMKYFVDDENTKYDEGILNSFLEEKNTYGYIAKENDIIVGFAFGYVLLKPNGIKDFYLHAIDIMEKYQSHGYGTELVKYISSHSCFIRNVDFILFGFTIMPWMKPERLNPKYRWLA